MPGRKKNPEASAANAARMRAMKAKATAEVMEPVEIKPSLVTYGPEIAAEVLERIACGETVEAIGKAPGMPNRVTIWRWMKAHAEFAAEMPAALEMQAITWADQIIDLADDSSKDTTETPDGREVLNREHIERTKVRIGTRQWLMTRRNRGEFGDKSELKVTRGLDDMTEAELIAMAKEKQKSLGLDQ